jgi:hypothetical protein
MMQTWNELLAVVEQMCLNEDSDALYWCYEKFGVYSSQSFYVVINYRGLAPVYILAVWDIQVPPKIHLFLWHLSNNKLATVDDPVRCCFCNEMESIHHLCFKCVVARVVWSYVMYYLGFAIGCDYISVASKWL